MAPVDSRDDGAKHSSLPANTTLTQCWSNAGPPSATLAPSMKPAMVQRLVFAGLRLRGCFQPSKHKTFEQCWTNVEDVVSTLYKCYKNVLCLLGIAAGLVLLAAYCWPRLQADTDPMSVKCWASVASAGQYRFCPSQHFILPYLHAGGIVQARCFEQKLGYVGQPSVTLSHI